MTFWEVLLIGIAMATDAFAVTVSDCAVYKKTLTLKKVWSLPCAFAAFQFLMPVLGYYVGSLVSGFLQSFAKFLTAGIFFILAVKIVLDIFEKSHKDKKKAHPKQSSTFTVKTLLLQALATSIDALAVGITFAAGTGFSVFAAAGIIGAVTFILVSAAIFIGKFAGNITGEYSVWLGAAILLALAVKNLIEGII